MSVNNRRRYEIFVGIFRHNAWNCSSLCDYFHRLIPQCSINHCEIYSSSNPVHKNYSFAILTFDSIASVDQCLKQRDEIKDRTHLLVKRNLGDKHQRTISEYVSIHLERFDENYTAKNVLSYFKKYGTIHQWKIVDHGRTFILNFDDYDSVDQILLDKPHFLNGQLIFIEKYYPMNDSNWNLVQEQISDLKLSVEQFKDSYQSELIKNRRFIEENLLRKQTHLSDIIQNYIYLRHHVDLLYRMNIQLKKQIQQTIHQNRCILDEYYHEIQLQKFINASLQEIVSQKSS